MISDAYWETYRHRRAVDSIRIGREASGGGVSDHAARCSAGRSDIRVPGDHLHATPPTTILSRRAAELADVDRLIERLRSLGITPLEVHASSRNCEFRIEGLLGESALRYMEWAVRLDQERTIVPVAAAPVELQMIFKELAKVGIGIDHIIRHHGT